MWLIPTALALLVVGVLVGHSLVTAPALTQFFARYPGVTPLPEGAPVGIPAWLAWLHFLNSLFLLFIVRSGLRIFSKQRPPAFWTRNNTGRIRTKGAPRRLSLHVWWHLVNDSLWVAVGILYVVLLFTSGHWVRMIPTSWDILPNAVSAGIQYLSLSWPVHDGWTNYNSLQVLFYFATTFIAAPVAIITGLRLSPTWSLRWSRPSGLLSEPWARRVHVWTLYYFIGFTIVHLGLVLATDALRNLNTMYAVRDDHSWIGLGVFALSVVVMAVLWVSASSANLARLAERSGGKVQRMPGSR